MLRTLKTSKISTLWRILLGILEILFHNLWVIMCCCPSRPFTISSSNAIAKNLASHLTERGRSKVKSQWQPIGFLSQWRLIGLLQAVKTSSFGKNKWWSRARCRQTYMLSRKGFARAIESSISTSHHLVDPTNFPKRRSNRHPLLPPPTVTPSRYQSLSNSSESRSSKTSSTWLTTMTSSPKCWGSSSPGPTYSWRQKRRRSVLSAWHTMALSTQPRPGRRTGRSANPGSLSSSLPSWILWWPRSWNFQANSVDRTNMSWRNCRPCLE